MKLEKVVDKRQAQLLEKINKGRYDFISYGSTSQEQFKSIIEVFTFGCMALVKFMGVNTDLIAKEKLLSLIKEKLLGVAFYEYFYYIYGEILNKKGREWYKVILDEYNKKGNYQGTIDKFINK